MNYTKPVMWNGKDLVGWWEVTRKVDGIRVLVEGGKVVSRNGKPLYNMDHLKSHIPPEGCEVFLGTFKKTVESARTHSYKPIPRSALFSLQPIDPRLDAGRFHFPSAKRIWRAYEYAVGQGYEGLVLRQGNKWLKVKKHETIDTTVIGFYAGKGKHSSRLGGFITKHGRVGTGITDKEREEWWPKGWATSLVCDKAGNVWPEYAGMHPLFQTTIECECMELTPAGKMRKPRFKRLRPDK
jgi:hypothetical protein